MPEGDTVLVTAGRLHRALAGARLTRTDLRVAAFATTDLSGQTLLEVGARGKHLLMRTDVGVTVHSHLKMEGAWELRRVGRSLPRPAHEIRAVIATAEWAAVGLRLGILEVFPTADEAERLGHLGPDVLGPDWDPDEALRRLLRDPDRPIHEAVQDQRVMAGPGNVYANELCFLRGLHPSTPVGSVRDPDALVALTKRVMEVNRTLGRQVTTGDTRRGRANWVYGRRGEPCRRCGTPIRRLATNEDRVRYWCPACQPAADRSQT